MISCGKNGKGPSCWGVKKTDSSRRWHLVEIIYLTGTFLVFQAAGLMDLSFGEFSRTQSVPWVIHTAYRLRAAWWPLPTIRIIYISGELPMRFGDEGFFWNWRSEVLRSTATSLSISSGDKGGVKFRIHLPGVWLNWGNTQLSGFTSKIFTQQHVGKLLYFSHVNRVIEWGFKKQQLWHWKNPVR